MSKNKYWKHGSTETHRYLLCLILTFFVSMIVVSAFNQAFAGEDVHGKINTSGEYTSSDEYTMEAHGKDVYSHETHSGDWTAATIDGTAFRLQDSWAKYIFEVPHELYDEQQIVRFEVAVLYDNVDYADRGGSENAPPYLQCYNREDSKWDHWSNFQATGDGQNKALVAGTSDIYPDDPNYHIQSSGGGKYQIHLLIVAPDGDGGAPGDDDAEVDIDDVWVNLWVKEPNLTVLTSNINIGDIYTETTPSTTEYNKSRKKQLRFQNTGESGSMLDWELETGKTSLKVSTSSGKLFTGSTQVVDVWVEGTTSIGEYASWVKIKWKQGKWDRINYADVSAYHRKTRLMSFISPPVSSLNDSVNIALNSAVGFEVEDLRASSSYKHPRSQIIGYRWAKVAAGVSPSAFTQTSGPITNYDGSNFKDPAGYEVYCKSVEQTDGIEVESELASVAVRAWTRPNVKDTPPQAAIDAGDVSWYAGRYAGVTGEPVQLMADGNVSPQNNDGSEIIEKYIWDFDDNWNTVEREQLPGQVVSHTWDDANLNGRIRCKAVTNYGIESGFSRYLCETSQEGASEAYVRDNETMGLCDHGTKDHEASRLTDWSVNHALLLFPPGSAEKGMVLLTSPIVLLSYCPIVQESFKRCPRLDLKLHTK